MKARSVEWILEKLEPIMPEEVGHWKSALILAPKNDQELLRAHIRSVASIKLDAHVLLSLPGKKQAAGSIGLGTIQYVKPMWPLGLHTSEVLQNLAIFGRSGSGKTNVTLHIVKQLLDAGVRVILWDFKRNGRELLPLLKKTIPVYTLGRSVAPFPFDPFLIPPGTEAKTYWGIIVELIGRAFTLGDGAKSMILSALAELHSQGKNAGLEKVHAAVLGLEENQRSRGWKISAIRALTTLKNSCYLEQSDDQAAMVRGLSKSSAFLEVDGMPRAVQVVLMETVGYWLYHERMAARTREKLTLAIVIEEAHNVLSSTRSREGVLDTLLRQGRELGIGHVIVSQSVAGIARSVIANTFCSVFLNSKLPADNRIAAEILGLSEEERPWLSRLQVGRAIVRLQDRWTKPILLAGC